MPPKPPIYVETSAWSTVVDNRIKGRQEVTRRFLRRVSRHRRLLVSDLALAEIDEHPRRDIRKKIVKYLRARRPKVLGPTVRLKRITDTLMRMGGWGRKALADVTQVGYAILGGAEALVTWNQKDLARDQVRKVVEKYCTQRGLPVLRVGTPEEVAKWLGVKM